MHPCAFVGFLFCWALFLLLDVHWLVSLVRGTCVVQQGEITMDPFQICFDEARFPDVNLANGYILSSQPEPSLSTSMQWVNVTILFRMDEESSFRCSHLISVDTQKIEDVLDAYPKNATRIFNIGDQACEPNSGNELFQTIAFSCLALLLLIGLISSEVLVVSREWKSIRAKCWTPCDGRSLCWLQILFLISSVVLVSNLTAKMHFKVFNREGTYPLPIMNVQFNRTECGMGNNSSLCVRFWEVINGAEPVESVSLDGICQQEVSTSDDEPSHTRTFSFLVNPSNRAECIPVPEDQVGIVYLMLGGFIAICTVVLVIVVCMNLIHRLLDWWGWRCQRYSLLGQEEVEMPASASFDPDSIRVAETEKILNIK